MLFISHDLAVVKNVCDRDVVNAVSRIAQPRALSDAQMDVMDMPIAAGPPPGCRFHQRCNMKQGICSETEPEMKGYDPTGGSPAM